MGLIQTALAVKAGTLKPEGLAKGVKAKVEALLAGPLKDVATAPPAPRRTVSPIHAKTRRVTAA